MEIEYRPSIQELLVGLDDLGHTDPEDVANSYVHMRPRVLDRRRVRVGSFISTGMPDEVLVSMHHVKHCELLRLAT